MISITGEMRDLINNAINDRLTCSVGTASKDGRPQISLKGSVAVYDEETLSYWERSLRSALDNVTENPQVVIFYRNPDKRINWRFHGTATVYDGGEIREKVWEITPQAERDRDPDRKGVAVLVRIDSITELSGNVLQKRD
ncbi:MAG: pyridoxamine 5'-phosphate oxidase family protein [Chloroflexi bacterium]|nr:pyridoxamine 5'-phosphate oxidase family protein [Chloroflexota bacterium]